MSKFRIEINSILFRIQQGDKSLCEVLYNRTYHHLKIIAYKYTFNRNDIDDVLIAAYVRVFNHIHTFNILKDGYNWMCKIVQNVANDFNKQRNLSNIDDIPDTIFIEYLDDIDDKTALVQELSRLSPEDQTLLYLKFWEGFTYRGIAKKLNMSKTTVHRRIMELIEIIRRNLQ